EIRTFICLLMTALNLGMWCLFMYTNYKHASQISDERRHATEGYNWESAISNDEDRETVFDTCRLVPSETWTAELRAMLNTSYDPMSSCNRSYIPWTTLTREGKVQQSMGSIYADQCEARCLEFATDRTYARSDWINLKEDKVFKCDIVEARCVKDGSTVYNFLHTQIVKKSPVKTSRKRVKSAQSVYILVIDSLGASHARRVFPETIKFMQDNFGAVDLKYMNKIGENSRPNGFAFLTGKSVTDMKRELLGLPTVYRDWSMEESCGTHVDGRGFIMQEFEKLGYTTMMAEDWHDGVFNWPACVGFGHQPATHYMRPFQIRYGKDKPASLLQHQGADNCFEPHLFLNDYTEKFIQAYPSSTPKMAVTWAAYLSHDDANAAFHADRQYKEFFERNKDELDNSFVILMGDHGMRYGKTRYTTVGKKDMSNPFVGFSIPRNLRVSDTLSNLQRNSEKLLTWFDLYETFVDIKETFAVRNQQGRKDFSQTILRLGTKGSSLLRPLPSGERSCRSLPIPPSFCICEQDREIIQLTPELDGIGQAVAKAANEVLVEERVADICAELRPARIIEVQHIKGSRLYDAIVEMTPGGGHFQALVRDIGVNGNRSFVSVAPDIMRLNAYKSQAHCFKTSDNRHLCYCKDLL
ncbi:hypothetical protein PENTCL1PPCAC_10506, partial [Pristionchus entomophagus]